MTTIFTKDTAEVLDYSIDYADDLAPGETIINSSWSSDAGITVSGPSNTNTVSTIWASGGSEGSLYWFYNPITTSAARTFRRRFGIFIGPVDA